MADASGLSIKSIKLISGKEFQVRGDINLLPVTFSFAAAGERVTTGL